MNGRATLSALGWTDERQNAFAAHAEIGLVPARVSLEHNHIYRVMTGDGEHLAEVAGRLRHAATKRSELPAVGDWVALQMAASQGRRATICVVLPRTSAFSRQAPGRETGEQIIAANIDTVFLVSGLDRDFSPRRIERYIALARQSGGQPVVVLNKADLTDDVNAAVAEVTDIAADLPIHAISTRDGRGFEALQQYVRVGKTIALLGSSGVGKSSIINRLMGREVLKTAAVRASDHRGRHTSVHRELVRLDEGGLLIDTPGLRELQLGDASESLAGAFPEVERLGANCRFRDCQHDREPGCAVKRAVEAGLLDAARYESYVQLHQERKAFELRQDERALREEKRQNRVTGRAQNALYKDRGR